MQSRLTGGMPAKLSQGPRTGYDLSRMGAGAARGANRKKKLEAAPWSGTWPAPGATLDLDFANNRGFVRGLGQGGVMDGITFTRASNGNYVNEQGLLVGGGTGNQTGANLLKFPQDFDNAIWTNINNSYWPNYSVISANAGQAPDGTYTADAFFDTAGQTGNCQRSNGPDVGATYSLATPLTVSCYVKSLSHRYFNLIAANDPGSAGITVDLQTGIVTGSGGIVAGTGFAISVGDGWYRVGFQVSSASTGNTAIAGIKVGLRDNPDYTFTVWRYQVYQYAQQGTGVLVWGAQLERGTEATPYFPTNINVPRFDWASTEQVAKRNLFTGTSTFSGWALTNVTVATNTSLTTDPFGGNAAARITPNTTNAQHGVLLSVTPAFAGQVCTVSVYAKADGYIWLMLIPRFGTNAATWFNLSTGQLGSQQFPISRSITDVGGGWYRCTVTFPANISSGTPQISFVPADGIESFVGDGTSGGFLFGPQMEVGSIATDYQAIAQPTTTTPLFPAPTCNGLLIEEARTNRLLWCRDATQTQWVKTDITAAKDQTGIDGVANAASSLTATADGGTCIQTITLASGSRTGSVYLKRLTGTGIVQVSLDGTTWSTVDLSDTEWRRIALSGTVTNPVVGVRIATSGDAVAMDFGQVEDVGTNRTVVTSPILTTSSTATRAGEEATLKTTVGWYDGGKGTVGFVATVDGSSQAYSPIMSPNLYGGSLAPVLGKYRGLWYYGNAAGGGLLEPVVSPSPTGLLKHHYSYLPSGIEASIGGLSATTNKLIGKLKDNDAFFVAGAASFGGIAIIKRAVYVPKKMAQSEAFVLLDTL